MTQTVSRSNILRTPLDIYESAKKHFSTAKAVLHFNENNQFNIELALSENVYPLALNCAIDAQTFSKDLDKLVWQIAYNKIIKNQRGPLTIDASRFSIPGQQLIDWQRFQCAMYERNGHSCSDAIIKYLRNPEQETTTLSGLGLLPGQMEKRLGDAEIEYFVQVYNKLGKMAPYEGHALFNQLQAKYPNVTKAAVSKISEKQFTEAKKAPTHYETTLKLLQERVFGQELAVKALAATLSNQKTLSTNKDGNGNALFLFVGPTGVGKTELAKAIADIKSNRFVFLQMNQYTSETDVSRLFGSASGYVGSTDLPHLAKELEKFTPVKTVEDKTETRNLEDVVILFDEFEKAHSQVKQSLLSLFDESFIKITYTPEGNRNIIIKYKLKNCIFICTSNLYQQEILKDFQQEKNSEEISAHFKDLNKSRPLPSSYSDELLARFTKIIPFGPIPKGQIYQNLLKAKLLPFLKELKEELSVREVCLGDKEGDEALILSALEDRLYGSGVDLREIKRYFHKIKQALYANQPPRNLLKSIRITLLANKEGTFIRLSHYVEPFAYHEINLICVDNIAKL